MENALFWFIFYIAMGFLNGMLCVWITENIKKSSSSSKAEFKVGLFLMFLSWTAVFVSTANTYQVTDVIQENVEALKKEVTMNELKTDYLLERSGVSYEVKQDTIFWHRPIYEGK